MHLKRTGLAALLVFGLADVAWGQQPASASADSDAPRVDVTRLPINLTLQQASERAERDGLRIRYSIDVYGTAPRIQVLDPTRDNLRGPVPYGAPPHQEMLQIMPPQEH